MVFVDHTTLRGHLALTLPLLALLSSVPLIAPRPAGLPPVSGNQQETDGALEGALNGNKRTALTLVRWRGQGRLPIELSLYHNSRSPHQGKFGPKWTCSYDLWLLVDPATGNVTVHWGDDTAQDHRRNTDGTFTPPAGNHDSLTLSGSTYILTRPNQQRYTFQNVNGTGWLCTRIEDRSGNALTLSYTTSDYLTQLTDPTGRRLSFTYDTSNRVTRITDPSGREWNLSYTLLGDLDRVQLPSLSLPVAAVRFAYNAQHDLTQLTNPRQKTWSFTYDASDRELSQTDPLGATTRIAYGASTRTITNPLGYQAIHTYDPQGRLITLRDNLGKTTRFSYDSDDNCIQMIDARNRTWSATFDSRGNVLSDTDPQGATWRYTYTSRNDLATRTSPLGRLTRYDYDPAGRQIGLTNPLGQRSHISYNAAGLPTQLTGPLGVSWQLGYDLHGNVTSLTDPLGGVIRHTYDSLGRVLSSTDATGKTTSYTYDERGQCISVTQPGGRLTRFAYDANGNLLTRTDALGKVDSYAYDDADQLTRHTDPLARITQFAYDLAGNPTQQTDPRGNSTQFRYNSRGELAQVTYPDGTSDLWSYDLLGQPISHTDGRGVVTQLTYNDQGLPLTVRYSDLTPGITFSYNADGQKVTMSDGSGTTSYAYNAAGALTQRLSPQGSVVFSYDGAQRLSARTTADGTTTFGYDTIGQLTLVGLPDGTQALYTYDAASRPLQATLPNGARVVHQYDPLTGALAQTETRSASDTLLRRISHSYDALGRQTGELRDDGTRLTYVFDDAGQLVQEQRTGTQPYLASYSYDLAGNRTSRTYNGAVESYSYDAANKLLQAGTRRYSYDAAGNLSAVANGSALTALTWDGANRLSQVLSGGQAESYGYNGMFQRVRTTRGGTNLSALYPDDAIDALPLSEGTTRYLHSAAERLGEVRSGTTRYALSNTIGSLWGSLDPTGQLQTAPETDSWGQPLASGATLTGFAAQWGYQTDPTGLMRVGFRYYDPSAGRFISRDPIRMGSNWYAYCGNDPLNAVDPEGLLHIIIRIGDNGLGIGKIYADPGDILPGNPPGRAKGGELIGTFPVSNIVPHPEAPPSLVGGYGPFPIGTFPITGVEGPDQRMGPAYPVMRATWPTSGRGTWLHGGAGENWQNKTGGCLRGRQSDIDRIVDLLISNDKNRNGRVDRGDGHRITRVAN